MYGVHLVVQQLQQLLLPFIHEQHYRPEPLNLGKGRQVISYTISCVRGWILLKYGLECV